MKKILLCTVAGTIALLTTATPAAAQITKYNDISETAAAGAFAASWGVMSLFICCIPIVLIVMQVAIMMWVYRDAKKNEVESPEMWLLICLVSGLIGLAIYYFAVRPDAVAAKGTKGHHSSSKKED